MPGFFPPPYGSRTLAEVVPSLLAALGARAFDNPLGVAGFPATTATSVDERTAPAESSMTAEPLESGLLGHHGSFTADEQLVPFLLAYG